MMRTGPPIESLLRRLAETPAEFLAEPLLESGGTVRVEAVVFDIVNDLGHTLSTGEMTRVSSRRPAERNWLRLVLIAAWLAHDPWFCRAGDLGVNVAGWLVNGLQTRAVRISADLFVSDEERREELARLLLHELGLIPAGESKQQAVDRLTTVDSIERERVLASMREKRQRAEELRKAMEAERAREAAARYSRE